MPFTPHRPTPPRHLPSPHIVRHHHATSTTILCHPSPPTQELEINAFVDVALGRRDMHRLEKVEEEWHQRPVDIALIDQNISLDGKDFILGTDIARSLHQNHFTGVACILTASSNNHAETLSQLTGVDLVLPKGTPPATVAAELLAALEAKRAATA